MPTTDENYLSKIEEEWQRLQRAAYRLTALDWAYADSWQEAGVPIQAAILGMRRSFQSFKPATPGARIRSLAYCYPAILDAWHELAPILADEQRRPIAA